MGRNLGRDTNMKPLTLALAAIGTASLASLPAHSQQTAPYNPGTGGTYGYTPPAGTPVTPYGQGSYGTVPPIERQNQSAAGVDAEAVRRQAEPLLAQADKALQERNFGIANELLERAQTVAMNTNEDMGRTLGNMASAIQEARTAAVNGDVAAARYRIAVILSTLELGKAALLGEQWPATPR